MSALLDRPRPVTTVPPRERISCDEFTARYERGEYEGRFIILLDGEVIDVPPPGAEHNICVTETDLLLRAAFGPGYFVRLGVGLRVSEITNPCPDIAVIQGKSRDFRHGDPDRAELVVEVSDSTITIDLKRKPAFYTATGTPEYWVIDANRRRLHVFRDPVDGEYRTKMTLSESDTVSPIAAPHATITVSEMLP